MDTNTHWEEKIVYLKRISGFWCVSYTLDDWHKTPWRDFADANVVRSWLLPQLETGTQIRFCL